MDKLKQVLAYKFWILLVVALILPVVGWAMSKSGLVKETEDRTKAITGVVGQLSAGPEDPNADWQKGLEQINNVQRSQVRDAWSVLYERQKQFMTWPRLIPDDPSKLEPFHLERYRVSYGEEIEKVRQIVRPLDEFGSGIIDLADSLMPHPEDAWAQENRAPTPKEVEGAQEDIWLMTALLKVIAEINQGATSQLDAPIRQVNELYLRGGGGEVGSAAGAPGFGAPGDEEPIGGMMKGGANGPGGMMAGPGMARGIGRGFDPASASFNPDDELGAEMPDAEAAEALGIPAGGQGPQGIGANPEDDRPAMAGAGMRFGNVPMLRYVQDKTEWRTRGFYIEVVMDHRRLPDFLVALANADWPIRVTRVHQVDMKDEELVSDPSAMAGRTGPMDGGLSGNRAMTGMAGGGGGRRPGGGLSRGLNPDDEDSPGGLGQPGGMKGGGGRSRNRPTRTPGALGVGIGQSSVSALDDHMLATVAIDGLITIFKKPPEPEQPPAGSQEEPEATDDQQSPPTAAAEEEPATETAAEEAPASDAGDASAEDRPESLEEAPAEPANDANAAEEKEKPDPPERSGA